MSKMKNQVNVSAKSSWNGNVLADSDGPSYDRLSKQIEELNKRVEKLEGTIKKMEAKSEMTKDKISPNGFQHNSSMSRSYSRQKSLNIKLVAMNSMENDKAQKSAPASKDTKLAPTPSSPSAKSPPVAAPVSAAPTQHRKPESQVTKPSSRVEPFMSRKNLASVGHMPPIQNDKDANTVTAKEKISPVRNFAQRYEQLSQSPNNLNRTKSKSATDVVMLQLAMRKTNPETKKIQLTTVPQSKTSPSVAKNEIKINSVPPTPVSVHPPQTSISPLLAKESPAAPPLPTSEIPARSPSRNSNINGPSYEASTKSMSRNTEQANGETHDHLMEQLKQFADSGFPFKRQVAKQSHLKSNTWNFSKQRSQK